MWQTVFAEWLKEAHSHAFTCTSKSTWCNACSQRWLCRATWRREARDHLLVNCREALRDVTVDLHSCPNLLLLPRTPYGEDVRGTFEYLGRVLLAWRKYKAVSTQFPGVVQVDAPEPQFNISVSANIPMYRGPTGIVVLPRPPPPPPPPPPTGLEAVHEGKHPSRRFRRNYDTAINTLRKNFANFQNRELIENGNLLQTFQNAIAAQQKFLEIRT